MFSDTFGNGEKSGVLCLGRKGGRDHPIIDEKKRNAAIFEYLIKKLLSNFEGQNESTFMKI
jgi:hypothetical protein